MYPPLWILMKMRIWYKWQKLYTNKLVASPVNDRERSVGVAPRGVARGGLTLAKRFTRYTSHDCGMASRRRCNFWVLPCHRILDLGSYMYHEKSKMLYRDEPKSKIF